MTRTSVDSSTGALLVNGKRVFPIGLSDPPPVASLAPNGDAAWAEIASAGVSFVRNYTVWTAAGLAEQLISVLQELDAASTHGLQVWVALAGLDDDLSHRPLLDQVVAALKGHPGLGVWKGADEPAHGHVPAAGCVAVYQHLRSADPDHPVVIIEAPRGPSPTPHGPDTPLTAAAVAPYAAACDIHGVDIYPVSSPPGLHAGGPPVNTDISVVGDVTRSIAARDRPEGDLDDACRSPGAASCRRIRSSSRPCRRRDSWPTTQSSPEHADCSSSAANSKQAMNPADRQRGWNWTYWQHVQRPLLEELTDPDHQPALTAPASAHAVTASAADIALSAREAAGFLYLIAVRRSPTTTGLVRFSGLPAATTHGTVLAHPGGNPARPITANTGTFTDPSPYRPHNARVYRFPLAS